MVAAILLVWACLIARILTVQTDHPDLRAGAMVAVTVAASSLILISQLLRSLTTVVTSLITVEVMERVRDTISITAKLLATLLLIGCAPQVLPEARVYSGSDFSWVRYYGYESDIYKNVRTVDTTLQIQCLEECPN